MKVEIIKNTMASRNPVRVGDIVDLDDKEGAFLVSIKRAKIATEKNDPEVKQEDPEESRSFKKEPMEQEKPTSEAKPRRKDKK